MSLGHLLAWISAIDDRGELAGIHHIFFVEGNVDGITETTADIVDVNRTLDQLYPDIAFNNGRYGVVWQCDTCATKRLYYDEIDPTPTPGHITEINLTPTDTSRPRIPSLAWNGDRFGMAFCATAGSLRLYFATGLCTYP